MNYPTLSFEQADTKTFRNLALAYEALKRGGNIPCILNAANEVVVSAFLQDRIGFMKMPEVIEKCMQKLSFIKNPGYNDYVESDREARKLASELI